MIDWVRVRELRDEVGAEDFDEVFELFLEEVEEVLGRLRTQQAGSNSLEADLHFLKGSAMSVGYENFHMLCKDGEISAREGNGASVDLTAIFTAFERAKESFQAESATELV